MIMISFNNYLQEHKFEIMMKAKTYSNPRSASEWSCDFATCIILGKLGNIPDPLFAHIQNRHNTHTCLTMMISTSSNDLYMQEKLQST